MARVEEVIDPRLVRRDLTGGRRTDRRSRLGHGGATRHGCRVAGQVVEGAVPYREAWTLQHALHAEYADGVDRLLLVEHPPTYTLGATAIGATSWSIPRPSAPR